MGIFATASESNASDIVAAVPSLLLHDTVAACVDSGWLLSFGSSRDGGAVSVSVQNDDGKDRVWCGNAQALEVALTAIQSAATGGGAPLAPGEGMRRATAPTEPSERKPGRKAPRA